MVEKQLNNGFGNIKTDKMLKKSKKKSKKKIKNKVQRGLNVASPVASALAPLSPLFLAVPIITSIFNEVCEYFDKKSTEKRLGMLECALYENNIQIGQFQELVNQLDEHDIYVFRNNVKFLCVSALPEVADSLIDCIISFLAKEPPHMMNEEICEILQECNANDIELLNVLKRCRVDDDKNTILWQEFTSQIGFSEEVTASYIMNNPEFSGDGDLENSAAFLVRSLLKMQRLGVIEIEQHNIIGAINPNIIKCFRVTVFGTELMKHTK